MKEHLQNHRNHRGQQEKEEDYHEGDYENDDFLTPGNSLANEYPNEAEYPLPYNSPGGIEEDY